MFLLILESIGTPELILIAVVALIVFGPRKLPQMAKTVAKTMAEFKNATNEFKSTWEKEAATIQEEIKREEKEILLIDNQVASENTIRRTTLEVTTEKAFAAPVVKELSAEDIAQNFKDNIPTEKAVLQKDKSEIPGGDKRNWL